MGEKGRGGRRKVRGRAGLSDGQSEGADDAVHGLVLPSHGAAPCGGKEVGRTQHREESGLPSSQGQAKHSALNSAATKGQPSLFYTAF